MKSYAAFLRGVSPMNAKMSDLKACFEDAGFSDVRTLLSSGNLIFTAAAGPLPALERRAEAAMKKRLGQAFLTIVRPIDALRAMLACDPYRSFRVPRAAKRVVTFLHARSPPRIALPISLHGARILCREGTEVFSVYVPGPRGPVFMSLIEKTFGADVTTRTWETVKKVAR